MLYSDNQSVIHLENNSTFQSKDKTVQLKCLFIRSMLDDGQLKLEKIHNSQNPADMQKLRTCSVSIGLQG